MATAKKSPKKPGDVKSGGSDGVSESRQPVAKKSEEPIVSSVPGFSDNIRLGNEGPALFGKSAGIAVVSIGLGIALGAAEGDGFKRFLHSYLVAYCVALAVSAGSLYWVTLQHLVNSHWSVVVRRIGELFAANAPLMGVLSLPIVIPVVMGNGIIYEWANHATVEGDHLLHHKHPYLNPVFFLIRMFVYFGFWTLLSRFYLKNSIRLDETGSAAIVPKLRAAAGPAMIGFALTITFCAIDLIMSVDAHWFSTIFGVYFFASCVLCVHATVSLSAMWLQGKGRLTKSVTAEHYHDLGKMLFAFTIFWAYVAFAQFMLIWYANIPEETVWFKERFAHGWGTLSWFLLFGHFVFPFFGMLSRHVKRNKKGLAFFAFWMLAMVYLDMFWLILPNIEHEPNFKLFDFLLAIGLLSALVAGVARRAAKLNLLPTRDPRLGRSLAFENI
jgi:hypothetical protein